MRGSFSPAALCVAGLLFVASAFGQTTPDKDAKATPKQVTGGVLNGKAVHLPKPNYPPAAKAVGATGTVSVQVLIDEEGYVASAAAVSGHPLLRSAAVEAAHSARFSPTRLNGEPVKVSGVITYNFVTDIYPAALGYELALAERTGMFQKYVAPETLAAQLPADWAAERRVLTSLSYETAADAARPESGAGNYSKKADADAAYSARKLSLDSMQDLARLQADIDARLRTEQNRQWAFNLGRALGKLVAEINDENRMSLNTAYLEQLAATAPPTAAPEGLNRIKTFIGKAKSAGSSPEDRKTLVSEAEALRNLRF